MVVFICLCWCSVFVLLVVVFVVSPCDGEMLIFCLYVVVGLVSLK